jgi:predicted lactoylglutathione lyase
MKTKSLGKPVVEDIVRTHEFYKALGVKLNGEFPDQHVLTSILSVRTIL